MGLSLNSHPDVSQRKYKSFLISFKTVYCEHQTLLLKSRTLFSHALRLIL
jgi:hypothetical protein